MEVNSSGIPIRDRASPVSDPQSTAEMRAERKRRMEFIKKHGCMDCLEAERMEQCLRIQKCRYVEVMNGKEIKKPHCPLDETGTCPYGNSTGTCFGFCIRRILQELNERRRG